MVTQPQDLFPSFADHENLRLIVAQGRYFDLTDAQLWNFHSYEYGWRRVFLHSTNNFSPLDPQRQWFDHDSAAMAEAMFRAKVERRFPRRQFITAADEAAARGDHEAAAHFRRQDRERAELAARIPDGGWETRCSEALAYVEHCVSQIHRNLAAFADRGKVMRRDAVPANREAALLAQGVRAVELPVADPAHPGVSPGLDDLDARGG